MRSGYSEGLGEGSPATSDNNNSSREK
jgi:hypothetical protein